MSDMIRISPFRLAATLAALGLGACASTPTRYYTLLPPPGVPAAAAAPYRIEVQAVELPQQVDTQQLVLRSAAGELVPLDTRRWIAPLGDELREALSAGLSQRLGAHDVHGLANATEGLPTWHIGVKVQRFESVLGGSARIDALWTLRRGGDTAPRLTCASSVTESVGPGYEALAEGHQQAVAEIAGRIAAAISGGAGSCPP
jgi:uncharacterized lipoprotein YmbA